MQHRRVSMEAFSRSFGVFFAVAVIRHRGARIFFFKVNASGWTASMLASSQIPSFLDARADILQSVDVYHSHVSFIFSFISFKVNAKSAKSPNAAAESSHPHTPHTRSTSHRTHALKTDPIQQILDGGCKSSWRGWGNSRPVGNRNCTA